LVSLGHLDLNFLFAHHRESQGEGPRKTLTMGFREKKEKKRSNPAREEAGFSVIGKGKKT